MGFPPGRQGRRARGARGAAERCLGPRCRGLAGCLPCGLLWGPALEEKAPGRRLPQTRSDGRLEQASLGGDPAKERRAAAAEAQLGPYDEGVSRFGLPDQVTGRDRLDTLCEQGLAALLLGGCCAGPAGVAGAARHVCGLLAGEQATPLAVFAPAPPRSCGRSGAALWRRARRAVLGELRAKRIRVNDEGAVVRPSGEAWYCGRTLGRAAVPNEDGRCGPHGGPQCASCARFQLAHSPVAGSSPRRRNSARAIVNSFVGAARPQSQAHQGDLKVVGEVHGFALVSYYIARISACEKGEQWQAWRVEIHTVRGLPRNLGQQLLGAIGGRSLDSTPSLAIEVVSGHDTHRVEVSSSRDTDPMQAGSGEVSVDQSLVMPRPPRGGGIGFRVFFESCAGDRALPLLGVATVHEPVERAELELSPPRERFGSSVGDSLDASLGLGAALLGGGSAVLAVSVTEVPLGSLQRALSALSRRAPPPAAAAPPRPAALPAARGGEEGARGCLDVVRRGLGLPAGALGLGGGREDDALAPGRSFMAQRAAEADTKALACGLLYKVLQQGKGQRRPGLTTLCRCRFTASTLAGEPLDESGESGVLLHPGLQKRLVADEQGRRAEAGGSWWSVALRLMVEGDKWQLYVPPELAFGKLGMGAVPPDAFLVVRLELARVLDACPHGAPCPHAWTWRPRVHS